MYNPLNVYTAQNLRQSVEEVMEIGYKAYFATLAPVMMVFMPFMFLPSDSEAVSTSMRGVDVK